MEAACLQDLDSCMFLPTCFRHSPIFAQFILMLPLTPKTVQCNHTLHRSHLFLVITFSPGREANSLPSWNLIQQSPVHSINLMFKAAISLDRMVEEEIILKSFCSASDNKFKILRILAAIQDYMTNKKACGF